MVLASNLGYPRIGPKRELKKALERFWAGEIDEGELRQVGQSLRADAWRLQRVAGLDLIPSNDFSFYDHVLDTAVMVGAVPERFAAPGDPVDLRTMFAMARGRSDGPAPGARGAATPLEMTKWFDTNYHYLVPELAAKQRFRLASLQPIEQFREAAALGIRTRPVLLGPVSFLLLSKAEDGARAPLGLLGPLLDVYVELLERLAAEGAGDVQLDEPCLGMDLDPQSRDVFGHAYRRLAAAAPSLRLLVATYFGALGENLDTALALPIFALHLDLVRAPEQLGPALARAPAELVLSLGLIDGRNVWKADLARAIRLGREALAARGPERVLLAPSCSLLHCPVDLELEPELAPELRDWLAFARQKLEELVLVRRGLVDGERSVHAELAANRDSLARRAHSERSHDAAVRARVATIEPSMQQRRSPHAERKRLQQRSLALPALPTTTIGSFPQTPAQRRARADLRAARLPAHEYLRLMQQEIERVVRFQEELGIDVLVHGEPERNDMVEFFGEQLRGFAFTRNGWVQSYGSRCVKPPIIYGDVSRPGPITVPWASYAQSLTARPVKGMLTGPITLLQWSFVRDDQPREETCRQLALAMRDEVRDLEAAGIGIIQIDEPALREGLPLCRAKWPEALAWAIAAFRLASSGVRDETQIHTHMCYAELGDIMDAVSAMDADVLSIEASRSQMELLRSFRDERYPKDIGPGVYDVHSPRVPSREEIVLLLRKALGVLHAEQLWVNPDCGLKTRRWEEVQAALRNMVEAARELRREVLVAR